MESEKRMVGLRFLVVAAVCCAVVEMGAEVQAADEVVAASEVRQKEDHGRGADAKERRFRFEYGAEVLDAKPGAKARVWVPIANSNPQQTVKLTSVKTPAEMSRAQDKKYGNEIGYFELEVPANGRFDFGMVYDVTRKEAAAFGKGVPLTEKEKSLYLSANSRVPIDGRPLELIAESDLPGEKVAAGKYLYNVVDEHMKYDKSKPGYGTGDSVWACDSRFGNCTDFHSLFISLARSQKIAAKFEIGFPLPSDKKEGTIGGYHCWAWFYSGEEGWFPVDISEADKHPEMKKYYFGRLTADRLAVSVGRDISLVPQSKAGPLNYFVYPHVEVDGVVVEKERMKGRFGFEAVK